MARTSTVIVSLLLAVLVVLGVLGLIYGPDLYREGKALVGPIVELSQVEDQLAALDAEMPFTPPDDLVVPEDRFRVFLDIRRELLPRYTAWQELESRVESSGDEDWKTAKEVLAQVREVAAAQRAALAEHRMPPAEFIWIEDRVYGDWARAVAFSPESRAVTEALAEAAREDLAVLDELDRRHGPSPASRELRRRFQLRAEVAQNPSAPVVEGVPEANASLFWAHREVIDELDLERYSDLHDLLRDSGNVEIRVGEES